MNPFDLRGPEFLGFYVVLTIAVLVVASLFLRRIGPDLDCKDRITDPYLLTYLRGGAKEVMRVALVSLVDRGILARNGTWLKWARTDAGNVVKHPVERAITNFYDGNGANSYDVFNASSVTAVVDLCRGELVRRGLLPDHREFTGVMVIVVATAVILIGVSLAKIGVAFHRGHHNVIFLIFLTIVSCIIAGKVLVRPVYRTRRGNRFLSDLRTLFGDLGNKARKPQDGSAEMAILAAVFGLYALPANQLVTTKALFPKASANSSGGSSSCGSGCGSSCGSGCGSGCGGGCGGCGS